MIAFRFFLATILMVISVYTMPVLMNHGLILFQVFFGDIAEMGWPGQFNLDFLGFLILSGFWLAWRHHFSPGGLALGVLGLFGGIPLLTTYPLIMSYRVDGDIKVLLLGPERAAA